VLALPGMNNLKIMGSNFTKWSVAKLHRLPETPSHKIRYMCMFRKTPTGHNRLIQNMSFGTPSVWQLHFRQGVGCE